MAGHSKWANIKHRKAAQDAKRGKLYTKLIREITVAARLGGGEVADNPRLRAAVDNALGANMPKDTIERAVQRGAGGQDGSDVEELVYEGYAVGGVAVLVEAMTDNRNRTVAEVRHAFSKHGGNLGTDGSVAYLFKRVGLIEFPADTDEEALLELVLEAGATDLDDDSGTFTVTTPWEIVGDVAAAARSGGFAPIDSQVTMLPDTTVDCDEDSARKVLNLIDALDDLDDVQNVYSNGSFPDSVFNGE